MKCDIKIMAVPTRLANVAYLCGQLGLTMQDVFVDYEMRHRPMYTSRGAFTLPHAEGVTHRLVLQDDVKIAPNLQTFCDMLVNRYPNDVISLFHNQKHPLKNKPIPYSIRRTAVATGQGLIIPLKYLSAMYAYLDKHNPDYPHDDWYYSFYCKEFKIGMKVCIPNVVDSMTNEECPTEMFHTGSWEVKSIGFDNSDPMTHEWIDDTKNTVLSKTYAYGTLEMLLNNLNA